jgi:hypothetical protein
VDGGEVRVEVGGADVGDGEGGEGLDELFRLVEGEMGHGSGELGGGGGGGIGREGGGAVRWGCGGVSERGKGRRRRG